MDRAWHDLLTGVLIFSLFPAALVLLAWRDWKTAAAEADPIGTAGTTVLALETVAAFPLPVLVFLLWRGFRTDFHLWNNVVLIGGLFWLIAIPATAIWAGKARRYLISACIVSFFLYSLGAAGT